ncbi:hypothetical protein PybrP1_003992 [[Pythium] brassicae (nom. inval.)]|nr:hypothetical protein PybrP1_003992 [[Pythium] brassicae (nom. inval.)]
MGLKKRSRAHSGIRLSKLPPSGTCVSSSSSSLASPSRGHPHQSQQQHVVAALDPAFAYTEIPDEVLVGSEIDLSLWSVVARDSCLQRLAKKLSGDSREASHGKRPSSSSRSATTAPTVYSANQFAEAARAALTPPPTKQRLHRVVLLNLSGAENITDDAAVAIGNCCPSLRHLVLEKALTDVGVRHLVSSCRQLQTLNLNFVIALQSAAVGAIGELQLPLRGDGRVPEFALQRVFHACTTLERLDLSFCAAVSDQLLLSLGQHCRRLQHLKLRGCRQVSDAGIVGLANSGGGELTALDLARFDLQYKLNDIALLSLADKCRALETLVLAGCEMLTDVGLSWLCAGCVALTRLDLSGCAKLTDLAMRAVGESLLQLRRLAISHCVRISNHGIQHLAMGCPELTHLDAAGLALLSDPRTRETNAYGEQRHQGIASLALQCTKLRHLDISRCPSIGDASIRFVAAHARELAELSVAGCVRVTSAGVRDVLSARAATLTSLNVSECGQVADRAFGGVPAAAATGFPRHSHDASRPRTDGPDALMPLRQLTGLRLRNCSLVSDATLQSLSALGLSLRELDVSGCVLVGDEGVLALVDSPTLAESLRYLWLRGLVEVTETGLSWIAERCRKLLLLDLTGCRRIQSFSIEALASDWKFAAYATSEQFTGMAPKHRAEDWLVIEQYGDCWRAATRIQCLYRARVARRVAAHKRAEKLVLWVATRLQSVYRGRHARRLAVLKRLQRNRAIDAATRAQSKFRQRAAAAEVAQMREARAQQRLQDAAQRIQAAWRRKRLRHKLHSRSLLRRAHEERVQRAATKLQCAWRGKQASTRTSVLCAAKAAKARDERDAANRMQSLFRARAARRAVAQRREALRDEQLRRERAALRVQAHVRRRRAQKELATRAMRAKRVNDAAKRIQRRWRAKKRWFASQLVLVARRRKAEHDAAVRLQAAWKRKQGRAEAQLLRLVRARAQQQISHAALTVQTQWRAKRARAHVAAARQLALERVLLEAKVQHRAAARVQAHFRGRRGRERYRELVLLRKKRWKAVVQPENGQTFYYNKETGEVRFRRPQDLLDLLPKPLCDNCGGRRRRHAFRCLYDFYAKRVDYGDGEFPSKWPSEIEQDEKDGWGLRMYPRRLPTEVRGSWERYEDANTGREWFYNKDTAASTYSPPREFRADTAHQLDNGEWAKYYDDAQSAEYYYNSRTLESTFTRPGGFATARRAPSARETALASGRDSNWEKYVDSASGDPYYYNSRTAESTDARPVGFQTARRGAVAVEAGGGDWAKYYDRTQGLYYYYNARTLESSFTRPLVLATPRVAPSDAASLGMTEFYDSATATAYYFNAQTAECQAAAAPTSAVAAVAAAAQMRGYR